MAKTLANGPAPRALHILYLNTYRQNPMRRFQEPPRVNVLWQDGGLAATSHAWGAEDPMRMGPSMPRGVVWETVNWNSSVKTVKSNWPSTGATDRRGGIKSAHIHRVGNCRML